MHVARVVAALLFVGVRAGPVQAQPHAWSGEYRHEQASVSNNGVGATWTLDRFLTTWEWIDRGAWLAGVERQQRYGLVDIELLTGGHRRAGDWTLAGDAAVGLHADFLSRVAARGELSRRLAGTFVGAGCYHYLRFSSTVIHQFEPALTWYAARGEVEGRLFVSRDTAHARTSPAAVIRGVYDVTSRLRLGGGGSIGDRIFNIDPLALGQARTTGGYAEARLGISAHDFILAQVAAARERPDFTYASVTVGYKRIF